jgi:hypothetical protein
MWRSYGEEGTSVMALLGCEPIEVEASSAWLPHLSAMAFIIAAHPDARSA